jgi:hypothetical protein
MLAAGLHCILSVKYFYEVPNTTALPMQYRDAYTTTHFSVISMRIPFLCHPLQEVSRISPAQAPAL